MAAIQARPATQKGVVIPDGSFEMKEKLKTKEGEREYAEMHSVSFFFLSFSSSSVVWGYGIYIG